MTSQLFFLIPLCFLNVYGTLFPTHDLETSRGLRELVIPNSVSRQLRIIVKLVIKDIDSRSYRSKNFGKSFQENSPKFYDEDQEDKEISFALATALLSRKLIEDSKKMLNRNGSQLEEPNLLPNNGKDKNTSDNRPIDIYASNQKVFRLASSIYFCSAPSLVGYINRCKHLSTKSEDKAEKFDVFKENQKKLPTVKDSSSTTCEADLCGTCNAQTPTSGRITSSDYPNQYGNNLRCTYTITAPIGSKIKFTFTNFSLERNYDYLSITDLSDPPLSLSFTGYKIPSTITSKSNQLRFVFKSDEDNFAFPDGVHGFWDGSYIVSVLQPPTTTTSTTTETTSTATVSSGSTSTRFPITGGGSGDVFCSTSNSCGICERVSSSGGIIKSPNYPQEYGANANCSYKIEVPQGKIISLIFVEFFTEECCDFISVYDGDSTPILQHIGGDVIPDTIDSSSNKTTVVFTSDGSNALLDRPSPSSIARWMATFYVLDAIAATTTPIPTTITAETTTSTEKSSPTSTQTSSTGESTTTSTQTSSTAESTTTSTQTSSTAEPTTTSTPSTAESTTTSSPSTAESTTTSTQTPSAAESTTSTTTEAPNDNVYCTSSCGTCESVSPAGGIIKSENYPGVYNNSLNCIYTITAPARKIISLTFIDFNTEECCDYVSVFDGSSNPLQSFLSGAQIPATVVSSTNVMTVIFKTDSSNALMNIPAIGLPRWKASFTIVDPRLTTIPTTSTTAATTKLSTTSTQRPTTTTQAPTDELYCSTSSCGICVPISSTEGIIKSQNYPGEYGSNLNCSYEIGAPKSKQISLVFTDLNIEECCDYVSVYDENWTPLAEYITGNVFPLSIKSKSRKITILFVTDNGNALVASGPSKPSRWQASFYVEESTETTTLSTISSTESSTKPSTTSEVTTTISSTISSTESSTELSTTSTEMTTTPHPGPSVTCNSNSCGVDLCSDLTLKGVTIFSPNFPNSYGNNNNNNNCNITISAPTGSSFLVNFTTFVLERDYDSISVLIKNGSLAKNKLSGYTKPLPFIVKSDTVTFYFKYDEDNLALPDNLIPSWKAILVSIPQRRRKKYIKVDARRILIPANKIASTLDTTDIICSASPCGTCTDLTSIGGIIRSPDYPGNYGNNRNCSYTIEVPLEAKIKLEFTTFTVEEGHDFISVFDKHSKPIILNESGYISPKPIITNSNKITLTFTSDGNNALTRFDSDGKWEASFIVIT